MLKLGMSDYELVIGLEIHAQTSTKTKMFCACDNNSFGKKPNINVCPICMAHPGMLPVPNKIAIEKGIKAALALKCEIPSYSKFDRKNYFYPDLPPGYQISQFDEPVSVNGRVEIFVNGEKKNIGITRLHLENDAGKLTHTGSDTLLDYNRAGTPLMEIVSEPDLRSAAEAKEYAETVQKILRYVGSSDCDMEKGMMRFDASVSVRPKGDKKLYPRAEIKNLNSFRSLERAIAYEEKRQIKLWESGKVQDKEITVSWDDERATTELMREKESAADYRYFPEPDIPPIKVSEEILKKWKDEIPELPYDKYKRFQKEYKLNDFEATFYSEDIALADYFEEVAKATNPRSANSFVGTVLIKHLKDEGLSISESKIRPNHIIELITLVEDARVSNNAAKSTIFDEMLKTNKTPKNIVEELGLTQVSDSSALEELVKAAIEANPQAITDIKAGKGKAMGAIIGYVMKESKGQANPKMVNDILQKLLL